MLVGVLLLAAFLLAARQAAASAARGERTLSGLGPIARAVQISGQAALQWLWNRPFLIGWTVTGLGAALAAAAVFVGVRRAAPIALLFAGIGLATWGQVFISMDRSRAGWWFYGGGVLCAFILGRLLPMDRLPGFPPLPPLDRSRSAGPEDAPTGPPDSPPVDVVSGFGRWEALGLLALSLCGLLFRLYALNELPNTFDDETIGVMTESATRFGVGHYIANELLGTGNGVFHVFTNFVLYKLYGISIHTVRLTAVFWGFAAIPLFYWLVRRLAGIGPAFLSTVLFATAPEQLFWSRSENSFFSLVAVLALATAHLSLSMVARFSPKAVLAAALAMPLCRFFYTPCFVMFTLPLLLLLHAVVFVRGGLRRAAAAAPILLSGFLLWVFGLSLVEYRVDPNHQFRFINPATVRGVEAWKYGIGPEAGPLEVVRAQASRVATNLGHVAAGITEHARYETHWYRRATFGERHRTMITAGLAVLSALGLAYLLGQIQDRRAALLLGWVAIGLLPACMSDEPEARRLSLVFPALPIVAGLFLFASIRLVRSRAGVWAGRATGAALGAAAALVAFAGLASHWLLPMALPPQEEEIRFARPLFERCDVILHNIFYRPGQVVALGNLELLLDPNSPHCIRYVAHNEWPAAASLPACDFGDEIYAMTLSPSEIQARRQAFRPRRAGYLLEVTPESRAEVEALRARFPSAPAREQEIPGLERRLLAMEGEVEDLRGPSSRP